MDAQIGESSSTGRPRRVLLAVIAAVVAFVVVAIAVWGLGRGGGSNGKPSSAAGSVSGSGSGSGVRAEIVSAAELARIARANGRPLYWAGSRSGTRIEYTETESGSTYVRYLTGSARAGSPSAGFVVVATYPQPDAYERVISIARRTGLTQWRLRDGAIAVVRPGRSRNVYLVYPAKPYQVEVYSPSRATTRDLVSGGRIRALG